ncbi:MAG TPA: monovalent cation/H+ antiporter complex subunit F [Noviherbaspirillum sp.]|uniref:monovalent cation/H+ antiporter complex subunit F n=1 Tax=Noviherbaspirillum sp. TaxID=1926288 RepID=UPI002D3B79ED|nr:monovalent cation/H+ antiporter complex subunit F [Noviherbaspirillum sp.]HYD96247.1 monovalent cation/H+ antiporter complex subunit F [Noviherbaspirillum sp.]
MNTLLMMLALFLLANLLAALVLVVRGPTSADRLLAALLFGTTGVAVLLLLARAGGDPGNGPLVDVALVFALLASISGAAFAQRAWRRESGGNERERP